MKKKIILVISSIEKGGTQKNIIDLFNYWKKRGHDLKFITFDKNADTVNLVKKKNFINLNLKKNSNNFFQSIFNNLSRIYQLRKIFKKSQNNHIVSFISTTNILTIIANIGLKNKVIVCERNDIEFQKIPKAWRILRKIFYRFADIITANSLKSCKYLQKFISKRKIFFIQNHIFFKKKGSNLKKRKIILAIGRLHYQKGFDVLIEAFYFSKLYIKGWKLVILGEGPERKQLEYKVKKLKINNNVFFKGFVNPKNWYRRSRLFVLSSRFEGTPNVFLEAISMGLPTIITNNCSGALYYVKDKISTLVVKSENINELSNAMIKLAENKKLQKKIITEGLKKASILANSKKIFNKWDLILKKN